MARSRDDDTLRPEAFLPLPQATFQILVALAEGDRHGYSIMQDVAARTGDTLKLNPGTLYTTIKRLLADDLIAEVDHRPRTADDDARRRYYRLTALGRQVARAEAARLEQLIAMARGVGLTPLKSRS